MRVVAVVNLFARFGDLLNGEPGLNLDIVIIKLRLPLVKLGVSLSLSTLSTLPKPILLSIEPPLHRLELLLRPLLSPHRHKRLLLKLLLPLRNRILLVPKATVALRVILVVHEGSAVAFSIASNPMFV